MKRLVENPEFAEMGHGEVILTLQRRHGLTCSQRADDVRLFVFLSFPRAGMGVRDRNFSHV